MCKKKKIIVTTPMRSLLKINDTGVMRLVIFGQSAYIMQYSDFTIYYYIQIYFINRHTYTYTVKYYIFLYKILFIKVT